MAMSYLKSLTDILFILLSVRFVSPDVNDQLA